MSGTFEYVRCFNYFLQIILVDKTNVKNAYFKHRPDIIKRFKFLKA